MLGAALVGNALVAGESWSMPLALCALSILLVDYGVWLGWAGVVTAVGAALALAAGLEGADDGLILASLGLWALASRSVGPHAARTDLTGHGPWVGRVVLARAQ